MKSYRPPTFGFKFPFRLGSSRSMATGKLNAPGRGRPSKQTPQVKQFTKMKPGRPAQDKKGRR